ncbi:MAG TPA: sigma-70 family RNA polymerase sigma factor [Candidatus Bariatricus faecipullorum]|nr:sigma-70 family RNA polymerase sigma factor [Candidatus Bariatricus faecipullorum]
MDSQAKDTGNFIRIYNENKELVFKTAMRYSDNYDVAQEIVQDTFLKLYVHFQDMDEERTIKWLIVTTKNAAKNYRKRARFECPDEDIELTVEMSQELTEGNAEDILMEKVSREERKELADEIMSGLYKLNERWYEAVTMVYGMEKKQKDVAEELGVSLEVLQSVLQRARKWVKKNYEKQYKETK